MSLAQQIAESLGGAKKTPEGYICKCPCHDDKSASLSLKVSKNGGIVLNCFAGCAWEDIKAEIERRGLLEKRAPSNSTPARRQSDRYAGAKFYIYRDLVGNVLCRKVKLPDKKMWFERWDGREFRPGLEKMVIPLYNLAEVAAADTVYLCEGEKDAETLIAARDMAGVGLVATTNHAGAKSWAPHLSEQLAGKTVIIIPDNDDAGRKRVAIVSKALQGTVKELRVFVPDNVPEHGDITDWVNAGGNPRDIFARSVVVEKKAASKKATREEYFDLFEAVLRNPRRCIFNEKLMSHDAATGLWNPAVNSLDIVKSEALALNETREAKFSTSAVQPHFFAFEATKPLEFLVDIPEWDFEDRISAMAYLVKMRPGSGVTETAFSELLKEWCALVFERLHNPMIQNRILVLQGGQGIGKDTWTSMLVDGLGQFCIPLAVVKEDKDTYLNLHRGLIMKISEFDKTAKTEVSTLKDIITAPSTNLRAPYDKDSKVRLSRCSFISSANAENLLRDTTGNRRFLIFELESIQYAYAGWDSDKVRAWQMQCLAQMVELARIRYRASPDSERQMREYIERQTPTDSSADMLDQFVRKLRRADLFSRDEMEVTPNDERVIEIVSALSKDTGLRPRGIKTMIQNKIGTYRRVGEKRFWVWKVPALERLEDFETGNGTADLKPEQQDLNY